MANKRSLNMVALLGNVGRDAEITNIPSLDKDVAKFSLATTEVWKDKGGEFQEDTTWHDIVAWGHQARKAEKHARKGACLMIEGKLKTEKWQDRDGVERRRTVIQAENITLIIPAKGDSSEPEAEFKE